MSPDGQGALNPVHSNSGRLTKVSDIEPRVIEWLWQERFPKGMISVIAGQPDGGKSLFSLFLAGMASFEGHVIVSAREDARHEMLRPRLEAVGAMLEQVHLFSHLSLPSDLDVLEAEVIANEVGLVVIDPVAAHLDRGVSRYGDSMRRVTEPLAEMAERTHVAVVLIEHTLKTVSKSSHPLAAIGGGSSGLRAAARMAFIGGKDPDDDERMVLCNVKANASGRVKALAFALDVATYTDARGREAETGLLRFREECEFDVMKLLVRPSDGKPGRPPTQRAFAAEWLTEYLYGAVDHEAATTDICREALRSEITMHTLNRAAHELKIEKFQRGRAWWWKLSEELAELMDAASESEGDSGDDDDE